MQAIEPTGKMMEGLGPGVQFFDVFSHVRSATDFAPSGAVIVGRVCGRKHFIRSLTGHFPEVVASIPECSRGLLHCEMGTCAGATQAALEDGDFATAQAHFDFAEKLWRVAGPALENALAVSYLEHIDFDKKYGRSASARDMLPPCLRAGLAELEEYLRRLYAPK